MSYSSSKRPSFRVKGGGYVQKLKTDNVNLNEEYVKLKKVNKELEEMLYQSEKNRGSNQRALIERDDRLLEAQAKISILESENFDLKNSILKYENMKNESMKKKLFKFFKPIKHIKLMIVEKMISSSKMIIKFPKKSKYKKYDNERVKFELRKVKKEWQKNAKKLKSDLENAEKRIREKTDELELSNKKIGNLNRKNSRLNTRYKNQIKERDEKINKQKQQILSYKNQKRKNMRSKGYQVAPNTVSDSLEFVESKYPNIFVTKDAKKGAKKCIFENPLEVLESLDVIAKRHERWIKSGKEGRLNLAKDEGVGGKKIDIANSDSTDWLSEYNGQTYKVRKHIRIGTDYNQKRCLRIYFDCIDDKLVIFYCSKHP